MIRLAPQRREIYRNYTKFLDFLAGITALTSLVLLILVAFMQFINGILAKHLLFQVLFDSNSLRNISKFEKDFLNGIEDLDLLSKKRSIIKSKVL